MLKLSDKVWIDPQRVVAVAASVDGTSTIIYLDTHEKFAIPIDINDVMQKINDYRKQKMREFLKIKGVL